MKLRVLLVDDHELMRQGLRSILEREEDAEVHLEEERVTLIIFERR